MSTADLPITVSRFARSKADNPEGIAYGAHDHTTWGKMQACISQRREGPKDGACFAAATFTLEPDGCRVRRLKAKVLTRTLIVLDVETNKKTGDIPPMIAEVVDHLGRWGKAAVVYTSHNHQADVDERYRVVLPISQAIDPLLPAVEVVADHLGLLGVLDTSKIGAASLFYLPSSDPGQLGRHETYNLPGDPLDAHGLLAAAAKVQAVRDAEQDRLATEAHAQAEARRAERLATGFDPEDSLIEKLRAHYDLAAVLTAHRYDKAGKKYRHPNSSSGQYGADIKVLGGIERVFSHNASDPLHADNLPGWCGVKALDAVDVVLILDHGGDRQRGLRDLAQKHGLDKTVERKELARLLFRLVRMHTGQFEAGVFQEVLAAAANIHGNSLGLTRPEIAQVTVWVAQQAAA